MRLTMKHDGKVLGVWVARTRRGFNQKQRREIRLVRLAQIKLEEARNARKLPKMS